STNEEGFRIVAVLSGGAPPVRHEYVVAANVTEFALPLEAQVSCPDYYHAEWQVTAFRGTATSAATNAGVIVACPPVASATVSGSSGSSGTPPPRGSGTAAAQSLPR